MLVRKIVSCIMLVFCLTMLFSSVSVMADCECRSKSQNLIKKVEYDEKEQEVSFDFTRRVKYDKPQVVITSEDNKETFNTTVIEQDDDELSVRVEGIVTGNTYNFSITGVAPRRGTADKTISGTFVAVDRD